MDKILSNSEYPVHQDLNKVTFQYETITEQMIQAPYRVYYKWIS